MTLQLTFSGIFTKFPPKMHTGALHTPQGDTLRYTFHGSQLPDSAPVVLYLHGFKGFRDWGFVPALAGHLAALGIRTLAIDFSHNGVGETSGQFTEPERFRANTFSRERAEAIYAAHALHLGEVPGVAPGVPIGLLGHSRGGGIAWLACRELPFLRALCTWAAVSTFARYGPDTIAQWKAQGYLDVVNARTGQVLELGWDLHCDLMAHKHDSLDIEQAARGLQVPALLVHGTADEAVPLTDAEAFRQWAPPALLRYLEIPGGGHTFGAKHPWEGAHPHIAQVIEATGQFFSTHLIP